MDGGKAIEREGRALEKGEYVIGIAIILAALLVSGTIYMGMGSVADAIGKVKLNVTTVSGGTGTGTAPTPTPAPAPTVPAVQKLSGLD